MSLARSWWSGLTAGVGARTRTLQACLGVALLYVVAGEAGGRYFLPDVEGWSHALVNVPLHVGAVAYAVLATTRHCFDGPLALGSGSARSGGGGWQPRDSGVIVSIAAFFVASDWALSLGPSRHSLASGMVLLLMGVLAAALPLPLGGLAARQLRGDASSLDALPGGRLCALGLGLTGAAAVGLLPLLASDSRHDLFEALGIAAGVATLAGLSWRSAAAQQPAGAAHGDRDAAPHP